MTSIYKESEALPLDVEGWPWCAICDKPVEKISFFRDPVTQQEFIQVKCHGQRQEISVPYEEFQMGVKFSISGRAFDTPLLPPPDPMAEPGK